MPAALQRFSSRLEWKGDQILASMRRAEARASGFVIARCVAHAKRNHPGWKRRTGRAERSIRKIKLTRDGDGRLVAEWGSTLFYVLFLELRHGGALRAAADVWYPQLAGKIAEFFTEQQSR